MSLETCRCGAVLLRPGVCTHCDRLDPAGPCPSTCPHCRRRDEHCAVCRRDCGTKTAAELCQTRDRAAETRRHA